MKLTIAIAAICAVSQAGRCYSSPDEEGDNVMYRTKCTKNDDCLDLSHHSWCGPEPQEHVPEPVL